MDERTAETADPREEIARLEEQIEQLEDKLDTLTHRFDRWTPGPGNAIDINWSLDLDY